MRSYNTYNLIRLKQQSIVAVLCTILSLIGFFDLKGQNVLGWEKEFGGNGPEEVEGIVEMRDRGLVLVGSTNSFGNSDQIYTIRTDVDGTVLWTDIFGGPERDKGKDLTVANDQDGVVVVGYTEEDLTGGGGGGRDIIFYQLDDKGNTVWTNFHGSPLDEEAFGISNTIDGGYIITGYIEVPDEGKNLFLLKIDGSGNEEFFRTFGGEFDDVGNAVVQMPNGNFVVTGSTEDSSGDLDIFVIRTNSEGFVDFENNFGSGNGLDEGKDLVVTNDGTIYITGGTGNQSDVALLKISNEGTFGGLFTFGTPTAAEFGNGIKIADDGNLVIAGFKEASAIDLNFLLLKVNIEEALPQEVWQREIGQGGQKTELGNDLVDTYDGGFGIVGTKSLTAFSQTDIYVVKVDRNGRTLTNHVVGRAFRDANEDCSFQNNEGALRNWIVEAKGVSRTFYGSVDADGNYDVLVDTGSYVVNIITPNVYWNSTICQIVDFPITVERFDTVYLDYPIQVEIDCPVMEVDVSTTRILPGADNVYRVDFCNQGTQLAIGATVDLILEKNLNFNNSTLPPTTIDDSLHVFNIGNIDVGECGFFEVTVSADNGSIENEAHCVEARILPDATCLAPDPNWDESSIKVNGFCQGDSVIFLIQNVGSSPISQEPRFLIVEDVVMLQQPEPIDPLDAGEVQRIALPANGKHYRLVADQSPNHPGKNFFATASVETCDPNNQGSSVGYVTQLEEADRDPYQSIDCIENQLSFAPIDFKGYPKGYQDTCSTGTDLVTSQTDLKYHIRFQNVSMDSSNRVVIRDTIPADLDITTIRPGASSHPYTFEAYGDGFVKFTFDNLEQVNSTDNEMLSHGFVKYRISQKPNNPVGTIIENGAIVFQDYNVPNDTQKSRHEVGGNTIGDFLCILTSAPNPNFPNVELQVYPNPFTEFATIKITGQQFQDLEFQVFDATGKLVRTEMFDNNQLEFYRHQLSQGLYVFTINVKGQVVQSGKLIIQ